MLHIFNNKEEAYKYIMQISINEKQLDSAKRSIKRATKNSQIEITQQSEKIIISITREGQDGYQEMNFIIDDKGEKITVQKAYNAKQELVHYDPKSLPVSSEEAKKAIATMQLTSAQRYAILNLLDKINDDTRLEINKIQENVILKINEKTINIDGQGQEKIL
jgi:hypothetical protein